jgi:hypothetical protein
MPEIPTFIILEGLLHESGGFELLRAFEDTHAERESRFDEASGTASVSLLDAKGQVLRRVTPRVHFPAGCTGGGAMAAQGFVRAALARDDEARRVEVRVNGRVAFAAGVAEDAPDLKVSAQAAAMQTVPILVDVDGGGAEIRIVARVKEGRRLTPAVRRKGDTHAVDLTSLEGLGEAELIVEASRGCRTARVVAATVALPEATVHGVIVEPRDEALWPWGAARQPDRHALGPQRSRDGVEREPGRLARRRQGAGRTRTPGRLAARTARRTPDRAGSRARRGAGRGARRTHDHRGRADSRTEGMARSGGAPGGRAMKKRPLAPGFALGR